MSRSSNTHTPENPRQETIQFLKSVIPPKRPIAVQLISSAGGAPYDGVFSSPESLRKAVDAHQDRNPEKRYHVYFRPNRPDRARVAVTDQLTISRKGEGLGDEDIDRIDLVMIDIDVPADVERPVPNKKLEECLHLAEKISRDLVDRHFPQAFITSSGNGAQMFWRYEEDCCDGEVPIGVQFIEFVQGVVIKELRDDGEVGDLKIDPAVGNPSTLMRLPGFYNWKSKKKNVNKSKFRFSMCITDPEHYPAGKIHPDHMVIVRDWYEEFGTRKTPAKIEGLSEEELERVDDDHPYYDRLFRAKAYAQSFEPIIGADAKGRRNMAFTSAQYLCKGFVLTFEDTIQILDNQWNQKNTAPLDLETLSEHAKNGIETGKLCNWGSMLKETKLMHNWKDVIDGWFSEKHPAISRDAKILARSENLLTVSRIAEKNWQVINNHKVQDVRLKRELCLAPGGMSNMFNVAFEYIAGRCNPNSSAGPLTSTIALISACAAKRFSPPLYFGNTSYPAIWCMNVSGTASGKNAPLQACKSVLNQSGLGGKIIAGENTPSKQSVEKALAERHDCGALFVIDEVGEVFGGHRKSANSYSNELFPLMKTIYNTEEVHILQASQSIKEMQQLGVEGIRGRKVTIKRPAMICLGAMTDNHVETMFTQSGIMDGWGNRWIMVTDNAEDERPRFVNGYSLENAVQVQPAPDKLTSFLRKIAGAGPLFSGSLTEKGAEKIQSEREEAIIHKDTQKIIIASITPQANKKHAEFAEKVFDLQHMMKRKSPVKAALIGRVAENAMRLATLSAICRSKDPEKVVTVQEDDVIWSHGIIKQSVMTFNTLGGHIEDHETAFGKSYASFIRGLKEIYEEQTEESIRSGFFVTMRDMKRKARTLSSKEVDDIIKKAVTVGEIVVLGANDIKELMKQRGAKYSGQRMGIVPCYDSTHSDFSRLLN